MCFQAGVELMQLQFRLTVVTVVVGGVFGVLLQVLASQCLTALCASAGGGDGCTVAEQPEIDVLLDALLSPCFSVRDAALRVSLRVGGRSATRPPPELTSSLSLCSGAVGDGVCPPHRQHGGQRDEPAAEDLGRQV